MAHDSMGCVKLLNRDLLHTVNITENLDFTTLEYDEGTRKCLNYPEIGRHLFESAYVEWLFVSCSMKVAEICYK